MPVIRLVMTREQEQHCYAATIRSVHGGPGKYHHSTML